MKVTGEGGEIRGMRGVSKRGVREREGKIRERDERVKKGERPIERGKRIY